MLLRSARAMHRCRSDVQSHLSEGKDLTSLENADIVTL